MKRLIICLLVLLAAPAYAAAPYVVPGVTVDVTADNAAAARNQAIIEGQRKAFMNLATQLAAGGPVPEVSDRQIGDMVSDFRVEKEQFGAKRYVGSFTFRFRQNPVRAAFGSRYIASPHEIAAQSAAPVTATGLPPVIISSGSDDANDLINSEASQTIALQPPAPITAANIDMNAPIKMMIIEARGNNMQSAEEQLRMMPGVVNLTYGPNNGTVHMAYRGDTAQLVNELRTRGVTLQQRLPTQPPIYTLAP